MNGYEDIREAASRALVLLVDRKGDIRPAVLDGVEKALSALPARSVVWASSKVPREAGLWIQHPPPVSLPGWLTADSRALKRQPRLALPFLFHFSGHIREAALHTFEAGLASPFHVAAIAYRLNDWVPEVRAAAVAAIGRTFPGTHPAILADAATFLLPAMRDWGRQDQENGFLEQTLLTPAVRDALFDQLMSTRSGPAAWLLRFLLIRSDFDGRLLDLGRKARLASVRALAMRALIESETRWHVGWRKQWTPDKAVQRIKVWASRPIAAPAPTIDLIRIAAADRSALVRKTAADGLIAQPDLVKNLSDLVRQLAADRNRGLRERAEFILRREVAN